MHVETLNTVVGSGPACRGAQSFCALVSLDSNADVTGTAVVMSQVLQLVMSQVLQLLRHRCYSCWQVVEFGPACKGTNQC